MIQAALHGGEVVRQDLTGALGLSPAEAAQAQRLLPEMSPNRWASETFPAWKELSGLGPKNKDKGKDKQSRVAMFDVALNCSFLR